MQQVMSFDKDLYSLTILQKSAYKFSRTSDVVFTQDDQNFICTFSLSDKFTDEQVTLFVSEYHKEVLDQGLREQIRSETEVTRNLILAHAFSKAELEEDE